MNNRSWRGTILFTVILVVLGATVGLKLYGVGTETGAPETAVHSTVSRVPAAPSAAATVVTGSAVDTRYGPVQVKLTFSGDAITGVDVIQAPDHGRRDIEISNRALPILAQEVLSSQSADIDSVSGATYTSEGYQQSVQSAIDQR